MVDILLASFLVYQYWLLLLVCILGAFGFPIPATALLIAGGALYAQGYFDITYLFLAGFTGCMIGDLLGYGLSYRYGKKVFVRLRLTRFIDIDRLLSKYGPSFIRRSVLSVFLTRWAVTGLGPSVNIIAGLTKMRPAKYIPIDILGELVYITLYMSIGYTFGTQWEEILDIIETFSTMILSGALLSIALYFFWKHSKKRREEAILAEWES